MLSLDFHCKDNDGTTGAVHLIQTFFKNQTPVVRRLLTLLISGDVAKKISGDIVKKKSE